MSLSKNFISLLFSRLVFRPDHGQVRGAGGSDLPGVKLPVSARTGRRLRQFFEPAIRRHHFHMCTLHDDNSSAFFIGFRKESRTLLRKYRTQILPRFQEIKINADCDRGDNFTISWMGEQGHHMLKLNPNICKLNNIKNNSNISHFRSRLQNE